MLVTLDTPASSTPFSSVTFASTPFRPCHSKATLWISLWLRISLRCRLFYLCSLLLPAVTSPSTWTSSVTSGSSRPHLLPHSALLAIRGISLRPRTSPPLSLVPRHVICFQPWGAEQDSHGLTLSGSTANLALRSRQDRHRFLTGLRFSSCSPHSSCPRPCPSLLRPIARLFNSQ